MSNPIADAANRAMHDPDYEDDKGMCQKFVRQCVQAVTHAYDDHWRPSAKETAVALKAAGHAVTGAPQPGDLLYKTRGSGSYGHVGIYVGDGKVAENSSTKIGRVSGAKGYRTLKQYGAVDVLVRLAVNEGWSVVFPDGQQLAGVEREGHVYVAARAWARIVGAELDYAVIGGQPRVWLADRMVPGEVWTRDGSSWCQVRDLAEVSGVTVKAAGRVVTVARAQ